MLLAQFLLGCQSVPEQFQVIALTEDGYSIQERKIDSLDDPTHLNGSLGQITGGGVIQTVLTDSTLKHLPGNELTLLHAVIDGTLYPYDRDGLVMLSYYAHLEDSAAFLDALDHSHLSSADIFPVPTAVKPSMPDPTMALLPMENAAYAATAHTFILLQDLIEKEIPLASNAGIIAHELGHAMFQHLTAGSVTNPPLVDSEDPNFLMVRSLNEGFADIVGACFSQRSNFIADSMGDLTDRNLNDVHTMEGITMPDSEDTLSALGHDPYPLGSVFASSMWTLMESGTPIERLLELTIDATVDWADAGESDIFLWLEHAANLATPAERATLCTAFEERFTSIDPVAPCSG